MDRTSNNIVRIGGQITGAPEFSHEVFGEKFFILDLSSRAVFMIPYQLQYQTEQLILQTLLLEHLFM